MFSIGLKQEYYKSIETLCINHKHVCSKFLTYFPPNSHALFFFKQKVKKKNYHFLQK